MEQVKAPSADGKSLTYHDIFTFAIRCREHKESDCFPNVLLQLRPSQQWVRLCDDDWGADSGSPDEGHEDVLEGAEGRQAGSGGEPQDTLHHAQGGKVPPLLMYFIGAFELVL